MCDVGKRKYRTSFTHPLAVLVHARPELSLVNPVVGAVHIEVPANGIGMEGHEYYVGQLRWHDVQVNVINIILKDLLHEENYVFDGEISLSCRLEVDIMQRLGIILVIA